MQVFSLPFRLRFPKYAHIIPLAEKKSIRGALCGSQGKRRPAWAFQISSPCEERMATKLKAKSLENEEGQAWEHREYPVSTHLLKTGIYRFFRWPKSQSRAVPEVPARKEIPY